MSVVETFAVESPYDLALSLRVSGGFSSGLAGDSPVLRMAVRIEGVPLAMEVRQVEREPPTLAVRGLSAGDAECLRPIAAWVLFADLDLSPFYRQIDPHPLLGPVAERLRGLKPIRPPSLFEMAVTAVTEQQISMAAAYQIRARVVNTFGDRPPDAPGGDQLVAFPTPDRLAKASLEELHACGLSRRKAEYIHGLAEAIVEGQIDLDELRELPDDDARAVIEAWRGFGPWSANYILVRGLGRPDCVPAADLGVRTVVGEYLGDGTRLTAEEVREALAPFEPYRGMVAFYLLAHSQL
jgi:DNA-3-methyladenine glycosylase II